MKIIHAISEVMLRTGLDRLRGTAGVALLAALAVAAPAASAQAPGEHSLSGNFLAGEHARAMSDHAAAANYLSAVLTKNPDNEELLQATMAALVHEGRIAEALPIAQRLDKQGVDTDGVTLLLAMDRFKQGDNAAAIELIKKLSDNSLNKFTEPLILSWMTLANGKPDQAQLALAPLGETPSVKLLHDVTLALLNDVAGNKAAAKSYTALAATPDSLSFRTVELTMNYFLRKGDAKAATKLLDDFNKTYPDNSLIGLLRPQLKQKPRPLISNERDGLAEAFYSIAAGLLQDGAEQPAMLFTQLALDLKADLPAAQLLRGDLLMTALRFEDAVEAYRRVDKASPYSWNARQKLADALDQAGRSDEALKILQDMTDERTDVADAALALGNLLRSKERFAESAVAYDKMISRIGTIKDHHWTLYYYRGISRERSDQWALAEADFKKALELNPDQPLVLNYLAYTWVTKKENLDQALEMLKKAAEQRPDDGFIIDSVGWAYYMIGDYMNAVGYLERAVEFEPTDSTINEHLGDAYWKIGRHEEAKFQWRRALSFEPEEERVAPLQTKLDSGLSDNPT
ncbi:MAG TPA: tetratricopeptide repeat protein [Verrucomicrobiae bacterium]|nr:tetratricopeptide repeat protein [Verrucomicrobiae bacterium]